MIQANQGEGYDSVGSNLADQTFQQDLYYQENSQKMDHFQKLIQSNQAHFQSKSQKTSDKPIIAQIALDSKQPLKISSKNYIPIWNFFLTD